LRSHITVTAILGIAWVGLLGGSVLRAAGPPPTTAPAGALASFTKAIEEGDTAKLAKMVSGDTKEREWVVAFSAHLRALSDLDHALAKRFGKSYADEEASKTIREQIETARDEELNTDLKRAKLRKLDGDTVLVIFDESAPDDRQGRLVRADGKWKIEIGSLANYFSVDDTRRLRAVADAANRLAKDIGAGKFSSLDEAAKEVEKRLSAADAVGEKKPEPAPTAAPKQP
jgi:hypothetical protein